MKMQVDNSREEKRQRIQKRRLSGFHKKLARVFVIAIGMIVILNIIKPSKDFSDSENRVLAQRPKLTWESVKSGKYMSEFETYVSDQFILRNRWISLKLLEDKALGKKESNGVYLGKKGHLMEVLSEPDWENVERNVKSISDFAKENKKIPVYMTVVPNAAYILEDKMPFKAPVRNQSEDLAQIKEWAGKKVKFVDVTKTMQEHADEQIYYKTDHHWTSLGAKYAFETIAKEMKIDDVAKSYNIHTVADDFEGTLASKSGYHGSEDKVQVYEPKKMKTKYMVYYVDEGEKSTSIYSSKALEEKDKYTVFFGGNHPRVEISTTNEEPRNLLIFKDSYANCFVQFLLPHYQNIVIIDPRYFYDSVDTIIEGYGITEVLFLYNLNTFVTDTSIADVLNGA